MLNLLVAAALCSAPVVVSSPEAHDAKVPDWELFTAMSGGLQLDSRAGAATGRIGLTRRVSPVVVPELHLLSGVTPNTETITTGVRLGARFEVPREGLRPFAYVAFAHSHETTFGNAARAPVPILLGLSEDGVNHRTGADVGLGVVYDFPKIRPGSLAGRASLRANTVALLGHGAPFTAELLWTFGILF